MQPVNSFGAPVVFVNQPAAPAVYNQQFYTNMRNDLALKLIIYGKVQVVIGALCIVFEIVSIILNYVANGAGLSFVGHGIWIGALFVVTGSIGIVGGNRRSRCLVLSFNVLSIISASFSGLLLALAIPAAVFNVPRFYYNYSRSGELNASVAMESMIAILALIEGIVAILSSVVCCTIGACCCDCDYSPSPFQTQAMVMVNQQQMAMANQQPMAMANQQQMAMANQQPMITNQQLTPYQYPGYQPTNEYFGQPQAGYDNLNHTAQYTRMKE